MTVTAPPLAETPFPVIFDIIPEHWRRGQVTAAVAAGAAEIGTLAIVHEQELPSETATANHLIPLLAVGQAFQPDDPAANVRLESLTYKTRFSSPLVMIEDQADVMALQASLKKSRPEQIVAIRVQANPKISQRVVELVEAGAEVIHLVFDSHGLESPQAEAGNGEPAAPRRHVRDVLRDVHGTLVRRGIRDVVTLVASGGIAQAEHVAKAIICGADLVAIDIPLLLAMECRLCGECERGELCPIALEDMDEHYGTHRIVNLMGAWHQQLIEVLGAMGIREVRRLRGETGRAMFFEDLERETFGRLFGKRTNPGPQVA
jgi:hypothetical protein